MLNGFRKTVKDLLFRIKLAKNIRYLVEFNHTGQIEVFHLFLNTNCPKRLLGMIIRHQLAILDFNCGMNLPEATNKTGEKQCKLQHSKLTKPWTLKQIRVARRSIFGFN